ncbi:MAG: tetratricopeptide repeat protein [Bdellovibrionia bacterium]
MKLLLALSIISGLAACGTTQTVAKKEILEVPVKAYAQSVTSVGLSYIQASQCPKALKTAEGYAKTDWKELVAIANGCVKAERWGHVDDLAELLSTREPRAPWGAYYWALVAEARHDTARAIWMIDLALKKAPEAGVLHFEKGRLLWKDESFTSAMESLLKAVQLDGSLSEAHVFLGQIYFRDQDYGKATQHFYAVLKARPTDPIALSGLAESRLQAGDTNGALEAIKRAVSAYPDKIEFALREAYIFETIVGDKVQALEAYRSAMNVISSKRIKGAVASNVEKKISELEKLTRQPSSVAERAPAPKKPEVKR